MSIILSSQTLSPTYKTEVITDKQRSKIVNISAERPLAIYIDGKELVTLMTLGMYPEALVLGYLKNQRLIQDINELISINVNWKLEKADVVSDNGIKNLEKNTKNRIVTTGCGQGTIFSCTIDSIYNTSLPSNIIKKSTIYNLLNNITKHNKVYKMAGAVHSCALCRNSEVLIAVEDVGRHNAADIISGLMIIRNIKNTKDFIFYTTGRITSEIVMKIAQMGISIILSRSGVTQMGLEIANDIGIMIISRAKGESFFIFSENQRLIFD